MMNKINSIKRIIFPNKKINIFVLCMLLFGVVAGAIFVNIIGLNDKNLVLDKIKLFIDNINKGSLDSIKLLKNSLSINFIYVLIIWVLGLTMVGLVFNILLLFLKGFIFSFSIGSFILTYGYKGIILSFIYLIFGQLLNIIVILTITIYSIMFGFELLKVIFKDNNGLIKKNIKNYLIIIAISIVLCIISALCEAFILPSLIKLVIKLFI